MRRTMTVIATLMLSTGCANASARTFDSSNPISCLVIFGVAVNGAKQVSNAAAADEMFGRASFLAKQHGGSEWLEKVTPQAVQLGAKMEAAHDEGATIKLLDECVEKQDRDPDFRAQSAKR